MASNWVDFAAVKAAVPIELALGHYQVNWLRKSGKELRGRCPIHKGDGADAFHVSLSKNCFQCFSCKAHGNVLDFVAAMELCTVRDAALKLQQWFSLASPEQSQQATSQAHAEESRGEPAPKNKPLTFQLKGINSQHFYLKGRGIRSETAELFGIGFYSGRGSMSGRVVIPIHNERGELVAYAGRAIDGSEPKYKLPVGFEKSQVLFNFHRAMLDNEPRMVVVVEGFFDCLRVYEAGYPCVALMGSSLSQAQEDLLVKQFSAGWLMLDGDDAGRGAAEDMAKRLIRRMFVKNIELPDGKQPDMLQPDELRTLLQ